MIKRSLLVTSALVAFCVPLITSQGARAADTASTTDTEVLPGSAIEEVVVTAQRRAERLMDVPATVNVISSERLAASNIFTTTQLPQLTPGLVLTQQGAYTEPQIRGVGTPIIAFGNSTNVAVYIDGIYQVSQAGNNFDMYSIDNIQVLKGPQGTLYGRNATGGALLVTTKNPTFDTTGSINASYGSFNQRTFDAYLSTGITDNLAANVAVFYDADDGYFTNIWPTPHPVGARHVGSARGKILYQPAEDLRFLLTVDYSDHVDPLGNLSTIVNGNSFARRFGLPVPTRPYDVAQSFDPSMRYNTRGYTLQTDYDLNFAHLTSYTGYRSVAQNYHTDSDFTPVSLPAQGGNSLNTRTAEAGFSQEFLLTSTHEGPLQWQGGGSWNNERSDYISFLNGNQSVTSKTRTNNLSAFGEITYSITDNLSVTAGARYSSELKHLLTFAPSGSFISAQKVWPSWTPRAVVKYKFDNETTIYASYSKGFKSGGFNPSAPPALQIPFGPEKISSYEVGVKSSALKFVTLEAAAYHYNYSDIQIQTQISSTIPGAPTTNVYNAARAQLYGAEFSADTSPIENLDLGLGVSYVHGRYTSFPNATISVPNAYALGGNTLINLVDISGAYMLKVPTWTLNFSAKYRQEIDYGFIDYNANLYWNSGYYGDLGNRLYQDAYDVLNVQVSWTPPSEKYKIALWTKNLTNSAYSFWLVDAPQVDRDIKGPPRSFGFTLSYNF